MSGGGIWRSAFHSQAAIRQGEAVRRIHALFDIEHGISGLAADERLRIRKEQSAPLLMEMKARLREQRSRLSRSTSPRRS
jgi:Transposase IS66 family